MIFMTGTTFDICVWIQKSNHFLAKLNREVVPQQWHVKTRHQKMALQLNHQLIPPLFLVLLLLGSLHCMNLSPDSTSVS